MAYTVELTADARSRRGRIVISSHYERVPTLGAALLAIDAHWQRVGRRCGTVLHCRVTGDAGQTFTRTLRRDY